MNVTSLVQGFNYVARKTVFPPPPPPPTPHDLLVLQGGQAAGQCSATTAAAPATQQLREMACICWASWALWEVGAEACQKASWLNMCDTSLSISLAVSLHSSSNMTSGPKWTFGGTGSLSALYYLIQHTEMTLWLKFLFINVQVSKHN